jgi:hypothetical protein
VGKQPVRLAPDAVMKVASWIAARRTPRGPKLDTSIDSRDRRRAIDRPGRGSVAQRLPAGGVGVEKRAVGLPRRVSAFLADAMRVRSLRRKIAYGDAGMLGSGGQKQHRVAGARLAIAAVPIVGSNHWPPSEIPNRRDHPIAVATPRVSIRSRCAEGTLVRAAR